MAGRRTGQFQMTKMMDLVMNTATELGKAIKRQTGNCDSDNLLHDLQALVIKHGRGTAVEATASVGSGRPQYNMAGDVLCLAYAKAKQGDLEGALELSAVAMTEAPGMPELIKAIADMNEDAEQDSCSKRKKDDKDEAAVEVDATDDEEVAEPETDGDDLDETISRVCKKFEPTAGDDHDDSENELPYEEEPEVEELDEEELVEESSSRVAARLRRHQDRRDQRAERNVASLRAPVAPGRQAQVAVANKISITGDRSSRRLAQHVLKDK